MGKLIDLTGKKFGKLTVIERSETIKREKGGTRVKWLCKCDCGNVKSIVSQNLIGGRTLSCGCYHKEIISETNNVNFKHGQNKSRQYDIYNNMKSRCYNTNNKRYKNYGGRGIKVCDEWLNKENGFINFYTWSIKNGYRDDLTIDRINVDGDYEPSNCRWVTQTVQANNTTRNHYLLYKGKKQTMAELSRILNMDYGKFKYKLKKGEFKTICEDIR